MIATWQLSEAKNKFSELIDRAVSSGPQIVTRRGKEVVVVLSREDYDRITRDHSGVVDFFRRSRWLVSSWTWSVTGLAQDVQL